MRHVAYAKIEKYNVFSTYLYLYNSMVYYELPSGQDMKHTEVTIT